jgi:Leucine-rich repeat (LRR) protein
LDLSKNSFKSLEKLSLPSLKKLNLNKNQISTCAGFGEGHANLEILELRKNRLEDCAGISNCPSLTHLYLA